MILVRSPLVPIIPTPLLHFPEASYHPANLSVPIALHCLGLLILMCHVSRSSASDLSTRPLMSLAWFCLVLSHVVLSWSRIVVIAFLHGHLHSFIGLYTMVLVRAVVARRSLSGV